MCVLNCSKLFISKILQRNVVQGPIGLIRSSCLISKGRYSTVLLHRRYTCFAPHKCVSLCHHNMTRYYSDFKSEKPDSKEGYVGKFQQEEDEMESDLVQNTLQDFNIDVLVSLLRQENAVDICVIKVPDELMYTDYFIVASGSSSRHLRAMALYAIKVYKFMKKHEDSHVKIEGKDAEDWMCIDFGHMVVHFMLPETREVYELEKLWTLRSYDKQLSSIPPETLPEDFIYGAELK